MKRTNVWPGAAAGRRIGSGMKRDDIKEFTRDELNALFLERGFKACHAPEVYKSLYCRGIGDFNRMEELPKRLRGFLGERFYISRSALKDRRDSRDGTRKFLFSLSDGGSVECVYIPEPGRRTLCVSSQVGCKYGCNFCVSGRGGFVRNLSAAEMVNQVSMVNELVGGEGISNVVFMGTGEPLDNYDNLLRAAAILRDEKGFYIAKRKVSLSTCGIIPGIDRLSRDKPGIHLSVSLHAADDGTRSALMPVNKKYPLAVLKESARRFTEAEGFPVFFEYIMIPGVNISEGHARGLADFVKDMRCKINLIPYNPSPYFEWGVPGEEEIDFFRKVLEESGVFYRIRKLRGFDISAACGLLP